LQAGARGCGRVDAIRDALAQPEGERNARPQQGIERHLSITGELDALELHGGHARCLECETADACVPWSSDRDQVLNPRFRVEGDTRDTRDVGQRASHRDELGAVEPEHRHHRVDATAYGQARGDPPGLRWLHRVPDRGVGIAAKLRILVLPGCAFGRPRHLRWDRKPCCVVRLVVRRGDFEREPRCGAPMARVTLVGAE